MSDYIALFAIIASVAIAATSEKYRKAAGIVIVLICGVWFFVLPRGGDTSTDHTFTPPSPSPSMTDTPLHSVTPEPRSEWDFIDDLAPYSSYGGVKIITSKMGRKTTIAGKEYSHWIEADTLGNGPYYNLEGKYSTITFSAYSDSFSSNGSIMFFGDNDVLLAKCEVQGKALPQTFTVDVPNISQLNMVPTHATVGSTRIYLFDMVIR